MISAISSSSYAPAVQQTAAASQKSAPAKSQPAAAQSDTVQISSAAKAALQEATETPAQTRQEANGGDVQAKRLLARQADTRRQYESPKVE